MAEGGDFLGRNVNLAARVSAAAEAGQILVSEPMRALLGDDFHFGPPQSRLLKGFERKRRLWEVVWDQPVAAPT